MNHLLLNKEIKSYHMSEEEKIEIFNQVQMIDYFYGRVKIFEKTSMQKEIV